MKNKFIEFEDDSNNLILLNIAQVVWCQKHDANKGVTTFVLQTVGKDGRNKILNVKGEYEEIKMKLIQQPE